MCGGAWMHGKARLFEGFPFDLVPRRNWLVLPEGANGPSWRSEENHI